MKTKIVQVELEVGQSPHNNKTHLRYGVDNFDGLTPQLVAAISQDFIKRTVERLVEENYLDIVKALDMGAIERLITLEVARQVAGKVRGS